MQSLDDPALAFVVVNPRLFFPHYKVEVDPREIAELEAQSADDIVMWTIVTVPDDIKRMSVNLQGPLLLNIKNNRAKQIVLVHSPYTTCHYPADEIQKRKEKVSKRVAEPTPA
jgi:flagellar assembly factor FliW